jgi:hypothetical protein
VDPSTIFHTVGLARPRDGGSPTTRIAGLACWNVAKELPLERWYRELRIRRIGEGTNETQRMVVSRDRLRALRHRAPWEV